LVGDSSGNLYGTTPYGGTGAAASCRGLNCGTVFKLTPPASGKTAWTESVLYNFPGGVAGFNPLNGLVRDSTGALYGASGGGDPICNQGASCGNIYKLTPPAAGKTAWTATILYSFRGGSDGSVLLGNGYEAPSLTLNSAGDLFGVNQTCVFELTPPAAGKKAWAFSIIYTFGTSFSASTSTLILDSAGALYGLSYGGGANGYGGVFKLTPPTGKGKPWSGALIYSILRPTSGYPYGSYPLAAGLVFDSVGNLYGADPDGAGYGEVFELVPPISGSTSWTGSSLYTFTDGNDGAFPTGLLPGPSGALFGVTQVGGSGCPIGSNVGPGCGTIFELKPPSQSGAQWTETTLVSFNAYDGYSPNPSLIADTSGNLYGTTSQGGSWYEGVVFEVSASTINKKPKCGSAEDRVTEPACIALGQ
jgi:hypothetical protein